MSFIVDIGLVFYTYFATSLSVEQDFDRLGISSLYSSLYCMGVFSALVINILLGS